MDIIRETNFAKLKKLYAELETMPEVVDKLNEHFVELDGLQNKTEFSRCLTFFLLGRLFERGLKELKNESNRS